MSRLDRIACFALLGVLLPAGARADVSCSGSNLALSLGNYQSYSDTALDSAAVFVVTCTRTGGPRLTPVTVALGASLSSGSIANRQLRQDGGADLLRYNLYREPARVSVWGETPGSDTVTQTANLDNKTSDVLSFNIFARIDALQDVRAGSYSDRLAVTIFF